jgi:uncharacterized surface protein with fasciclin (FAS1) repeats
MKRRSWLLAAVAVALSGCASMIPAQSVTDILAREPELSTLNKLVKDAGLTSALNGTGPFTIFAPTNAAFAKVPSKTMDELAKDPKRLQAVLNYHVLPGKVLASDVKPGNAKTLHGANVALGSTAGYVNVEGALVTKADLTATNGVVHVIDAVLLPPSR